MAIKIINGLAEDQKIACDIIVTDPPFEMPGEKVWNIIKKYVFNHLLLICTMKQLIEFSKACDLNFNFDLVLETISPKKSKSMHQPFYTHSHAVYFTKIGVKTAFSRKDCERSDVFTKSYFPSIIRAPRDRNEIHGHAKNITALKDIIKCFNAKSVCDPFAGSGSTGFACEELDIDCTLIEKNKDHCEKMIGIFNFIGAKIL